MIFRILKDRAVRSCAYPQPKLPNMLSLLSRHPLWLFSLNHAWRKVQIHRGTLPKEVDARFALEGAARVINTNVKVPNETGQNDSQLGERETRNIYMSVFFTSRSPIKAQNGGRGREN